MSKHSPAVKRKRFSSNVSDNSGNSAQQIKKKHKKQTTELDCDPDEILKCQLTQHTQRRRSFSDLPDEETVYSRRSAVVKKHKYSRSRRVSWSLNSEDEDDPVFSKSFLSRSQALNTAPYDNNFRAINPHTRRIRRSIECCIFEDERPLINRPINNNHHLYQQHSQPLRSKKASQLAGHENEIQKQIVNILVREHDTKEINRLRQQRYSQSVSTLSGLSVRSAFADNNNIYTSLNCPPSNVVENTLQQSPYDSVTSVDGLYIHPRTELLTKPKNIASNSRATLDSGYAYCSAQTGKDKKRLQRPVSFKGRFGRKKLNLNVTFLVIITVIIVVANVMTLGVLLPEAYEREPPPPETEVKQTCVPCNPQQSEKVELEKVGFNITNDRCCLSPAADLLPALTQLSKHLNRQVIRDHCKNNSCAPSKQKPMLQYAAAGQEGRLIVWDDKAEINSDFTVSKAYITVGQTGYYFIYSRVNFIKTSNEAKESKVFTVGYSLKKNDLSDHKMTLEKVQERCFLDGEDVRQVTHLNALHHLKQGEKLFIELHHENFFSKHDTEIGMFLVTG